MDKLRIFVETVLTLVNGVTPLGIAVLALLVALSIIWIRG